jgi:flagellar motor protein MotB
MIMRTTLFAPALLAALCVFVPAETSAGQDGKPAPIYRVMVVSGTLSAVNYQHRSGPTKIDFKGTVLLPGARGEATVESKKGRIEIDCRFDHLESTQKFGREYLTYVLWAISPEGRAVNLGEAVPGRSDKADLNVTTDMQVFGLIVTAEPYFSVSQPGDVVVLENEVRPDTIGKVEQVSAKYELMPRGQYIYNVQPLPDSSSTKVSMAQYETLLELYQAQNAVHIARSLGADHYAPETYSKALQLLEQAQDWQKRKMKMNMVVTVARESAQTAEDARDISVKRQNEERLASQQQASAKAEAQAQSRAEAALTQMEAERTAKEQAQADAARANQLLRQNAERARVARESTTEVPVTRADRPGQTVDSGDKQSVRSQLQSEITPILDTRDAPGGLVVTIPDSVFVTPSILRDGTLDSLARLAAIVATYPGLVVEVRGHTDNQGSDAYDQQISARRAEIVRDVLVRDGIHSDRIVARGFGKSRPLLSNDTAEGRARNRRIELIISGEPIGTLASWDHSYVLTLSR